MILTKDLKTEILTSLEKEPLARIPASETEYLDLVKHFPFKIEYHESEIYTIGLASLIHELITGMLITTLNNLLSEKDDYLVLGSNSGVSIPKFEGAYYMPDAMVIKGIPVFKNNSKSIVTNPSIIVEVLSPATSVFDVEAKLPEYKHLESLDQIIFVNQKRIEVSSFKRSDLPNTWINQDFYDLKDNILIYGEPVPLADIYKKVKFNDLEKLAS